MKGNLVSNSMSLVPENVVIIGAGPAGYTAALYAARADLQPLVIAGIQPGGQLMITTDVENYPGFPDGIMGPEMMSLFQKQAERFGTRIEYGVVTKVDFSERPFKIYVGDKEIQTLSVIIATGAQAKWLGLEGEVTFGGYGVSACATCDGFFFRNKVVAVVGGGDTAMEEANYLTRHASKVILIHRRDQFRASKIMQERVLNNPKVEVAWNTVIEEIVGVTEPVKKVTGIKVRNTVTNELSHMDLDGVFVAIGHKPNSDLFKGILPMDETGYIEVIPGTSKTVIPGVFVAGDVADSVYRQAITAAGTGCMAAIDAERFLESEGH
jgi:thioredoxin reductase (NADPH)